MIGSYEEEYYDKGYFKTSLNAELLALFWAEIYQTNWVDDAHETIYKSIPDWYRIKHSFYIDPSGNNRGDFERKLGKMTTEHAPQSLKDLSQRVLGLNELAFFKKYYQSSNVIYIDLWNGAEEIPYHFDTINGADTLILVYLTESSSWSDDCGGQISIRKKVKNTVFYEDVWVPVSGSVLVINNSNPLITHKVSKLVNKDINRYTFSFNYKWF
jgi:hypothetical protein